MKKANVKINYLYHSGFSVETEKNFLIFDYYKDEVEKGHKTIENGAIGGAELKKSKKILVFASHSHQDHFNPVILEWRKQRADISYILSSDINVELKENINTIAAYEKLELEDVSIKAYGSTDLGVSFLVKVEGITLFHAGDLNWWHWYDEPEEDNKKAGIAFKEEIEKIKGENIDIAFFPVDPRLGQQYGLGAEYFIHEVTPKILIPMHFGEEFEITKKFVSQMKNDSTKIVEIEHRGQEIDVN